MSDSNHLHVVLMGEEGQARECVIRQLAYAGFELGSPGFSVKSRLKTFSVKSTLKTATPFDIKEFMSSQFDWTQPPELSNVTFRRYLDDKSFKITVSKVEEDPFGPVGNRYFRDHAPIVILTVDNHSSDSYQRYESQIMQALSKCRKMPLAVVTSKCLYREEKVAYRLFGQRIGASQIISGDDPYYLKERIDRLIREYYYTKKIFSTPYISTLLETHGFSALLNVHSILKAIRESDRPRMDKSVDVSEFIKHFKEEGSSIFLDIDRMKDSENAKYIPDMLESRRKELESVWALRSDSGTYDLRYIWLTAYGFEILLSMGISLSCSSYKFKEVRKVFQALGLPLNIRPDNDVPELNVSDELKQFVWRIAEEL